MSELSAHPWPFGVPRRPRGARPPPAPTPPAPPPPAPAPTSTDATPGTTDSTPGWATGYVPPADEWNGLWAGKTDVNYGELNNPTVTGGTADNVTIGFTTPAYGNFSSLMINGVPVVPGGAPGGGNTQVQFNNASGFGGDPTFTFNNSTKAVGIGGALTVTSGSLSLSTSAITANPNLTRVHSVNGIIAAFNDNGATTTGYDYLAFQALPGGTSGGPLSGVGLQVFSSGTTLEQPLHLWPLTATGQSQVMTNGGIFSNTVTLTGSSTGTTYAQNEWRIASDLLNAPNSGAGSGVVAGLITSVWGGSQFSQAAIGSGSGSTVTFASQAVNVRAVYTVYDQTNPSALARGTTTSFAATPATSAVLSNSAAGVANGDVLVFYPTVGPRGGLMVISTQAGPTGSFAAGVNPSCCGLGTEVAVNSNEGGTGPGACEGLAYSLADTLTALPGATFWSEFINRESDFSAKVGSSFGLHTFQKYVLQTNGGFPVHGFNQFDVGLSFVSAVSGGYMDQIIAVCRTNANWPLSKTSVILAANLAIDRSQIFPTTVITSASWSSAAGGTLTFGWGSAISVAVGDMVNITGMTPAGYNISAPIAAVTGGGTGITITGTGSNPGTATGFGTISQSVTAGMPLLGGIDLAPAAIVPPANGGFALRTFGAGIYGDGSIRSGSGGLSPAPAGVTLDSNWQVAASVAVASGGSGYVTTSILFWHDGIFNVTGVSGGAVTSVSVYTDANGNAHWPTYYGAGPTGPQAVTTDPVSTGAGAGGAAVTFTWTAGTTVNVGTTAATTINVGSSATKVGFNGSPAVAKPTVTGAKGGNVALASLLAALASYGLIIDSTTA